MKFYFESLASEAGFVWPHRWARSDETIQHCRAIAPSFQSLIAGDCSEEDIHQFLIDNSFLLQLFPDRWSTVSDDSLALSKFPVSPDRIPDFTLVEHHRDCGDFESITFVELKKPNARLFIEHGRMSKDLNDAWMESIDSLRIVATAFDDFVRRINKCVAPFAPGWGLTLRDPKVVCAIVIGRRGTASGEDLDRLARLSKSVSHAVEFLTYDTVYEYISRCGEACPHHWD